MFKSLIDIDIRKVSMVAGPLGLICLGLYSGTIPLHNAIPESWVPGVQAWAGIITAICSTVTGSQGVATLLSPKEPTPPKV